MRSTTMMLKPVDDEAREPRFHAFVSGRAKGTGVTLSEAKALAREHKCLRLTIPLDEKELHVRPGYEQPRA